MPKKLYSLNNPKLLDQDANYWERTLSYALAVYKNTKAESEDDIETRAIVMAQLAGIGLALHQNFGGGVESLDMARKEAVLLAGAKSYETAMAHGRAMESFAEKKLN